MHPSVNRRWIVIAGLAVAHLAPARAARTEDAPAQAPPAQPPPAQALPLEAAPPQAPPLQAPPAEPPVVGPRVFLRVNRPNTRLQQAFAPQPKLQQQQTGQPSETNPMSLSEPPTTPPPPKLVWRDVCIAPCNVTVDPKASYRLNGRGMVASSTFSLPRSSGDVHLDAKMGSLRKRWVAFGLAVGGVGAAVGGYYFWHFGNLIDENDPDPTIQHVRAVYRGAGVLGFGSAVGMELVAILLIALSDTSVEVR